MRKGKIMTTIILVLALVGGGRFYMLGSQSADMKIKLGITDGKLLNCPDKPNCVSSFEDDDHQVDPIKTKLSMDEIKSKLLALEGAKLVNDKQDYIHITIKSKLFGFVDDLELLSTGNLVHIRSASRVGYSDLGANKKRVEKIRKLISN